MSGFAWSNPEGADELLDRLMDEQDTANYEGLERELFSGDLDVEKMLEMMNQARLAETRPTAALFSTTPGSFMHEFAASNLNKQTLNVKRAIQYFAKWKSGEEEYGDGNQSAVSGRALLTLGDMWASGGDYDIDTSYWTRACFLGKLMDVKRMVEQDPRVIEKREGFGNLSGILHICKGAQQLDRAPYHFIDPTQHFECLKYLVEKGARKEARDFAGASALHFCLGAFANNVTRKMGRYLLSLGMDPNIENRGGRSVLFEATQSSSDKAIDILLEFKADTTVCDNDGNLLLELANGNFHILQKFATYNSKRCEDDLKEAMALGYEGGSCNACGQIKKCLSCSKCFMAWYCGRECQQKDWKDHKEQCKMTRAKYLPFTKLAMEGHTTSIVNNSFIQRSIKDEGSGNLTSNFILKAQVGIQQAQLELGAKVRFRRQLKNDDITVYDQSRKFHAMIQKNDPNHQVLMKKIVSKGRGHIKGYFNARFDKKGRLTINVEDIRMPRAW